MEEVIETLLLIIMFVITVLTINYKIKRDVKRIEYLLKIVDFVAEVNYISFKSTGKFYSIKDFDDRFIYIDFENNFVICRGKKVKRIEDCNLSCKLAFLPEIVNGSYGMIMRCIE